MEIPIHQLIELRKELHRYPELSGQEEKTSEKIEKFVKQFNPDEIIENIGGYGLAFIFKGNGNNPTVLIRSELDALPISETNKFNYKSEIEDVSHKCGHDGHMATVAGLADLLKEKKYLGKVILLFQPAEETGEGAAEILSDKKFENIHPDFVFAFHNLPGFPLNKIILSDGNFASASKGMIVKLFGKSSHAAEPEKGINPAKAVSKIINKLISLPDDLDELKDFALITIVHAKVGNSAAFGTSPGEGEVNATLRAYFNEDMELLSDEAVKIIELIADQENIKCKISWTEVFPAVNNNPDCTRIISESAEENNLDVDRIEHPFRWSEDFGHFTEKFNGALFGIGAGENHPALHNPDYDFPDELISTGIKMFNSIINKIMNSKDV